MKYYYRSVLANHWHMLSCMIEEAYAAEYNDDDLLVMGANIYTTCVNIKQTLNYNGKLIVYQLEPLVSNHWHPVNDIINTLQGADEVWDYDLDNIEILRQHGINAKFRPIVYSSNLKRINNNSNPDIDILFFGTPTEYRSKFLENLVRGYVIKEEYGNTFEKLNVVTLYNFTDEKLDEFIGRSKVILNINPYEGETRQQQTRIFYSLINDKCVMSQRSTRNYFGNCIVEFDDFQDFGDKILNLLSTDAWRNYPSFSNLPTVDAHRDYQNFLNRIQII